MPAVYGLANGTTLGVPFEGVMKPTISDDVAALVTSTYGPITEFLNEVHAAYHRVALNVISTVLRQYDQDRWVIEKLHLPDTERSSVFRVLNYSTVKQQHQLRTLLADITRVRVAQGEHLLTIVKKSIHGMASVFDDLRRDLDHAVASGLIKTKTDISCQTEFARFSLGRRGSTSLPRGRTKSVSSNS